MAISQGKQGKLFTEINITPLTDIFLVLLIIMMVIAPMFQDSNKEIKVPTIQKGQTVEETPVVVEITKEGRLFANAQPAASEEELTSLLTGLLANAPDKHVIVRADQSTHSSEVMKVFQAAGAAGFEKMTIAGEPLGAGRQADLMEGDAPLPEETP